MCEHCGSGVGTPVLAAVAWFDAGMTDARSDADRDAAARRAVEAVWRIRAPDRRVGQGDR
jgi:hypothetical protein